MFSSERAMMFLSIHSCMFPFTRNQFCMEWLMNWWYRQFFRLSTLSTSLDRPSFASVLNHFTLFLRTYVNNFFGEEYSLCCLFCGLRVYFLSMIRIDLEVLDDAICSVAHWVDHFHFCSAVPISWKIWFESKVRASCGVHHSFHVIRNLIVFGCFLLLVS